MYSDFTKIQADDLTSEFEKYKDTTSRIADLLRDDFLLNEVSEKLSNCGDFLGFSKGADGKYNLVSANFCRQRLCPMCQKRKSLKMYANTLQVCAYLEKYKVRYIHLVLTVPNCKGGTALNKCVSELFKSFGRFYKYKEIKKAFRGCLRCLEITYNEKVGTFHPHLHCLVAVNESYFTSRDYLSYDKLRLLWQRACNSGGPYQISVGAIKGDVAKGVAEVCKYCVKPLELGNLDTTAAQYVLRTYGIVLKGQRCVQKYGLIKEAFKALGIEEEETFCIADNYDEVYYFRYDKGLKKYVRY